MTNLQQMKSDISTMDRREMEDETIRDSRIKNDELTIVRRAKTDKTIEMSRLKNDEKTLNRREAKDANPILALAIFLPTLIIFGTIAYFIFI